MEYELLRAIEDLESELPKILGSDCYELDCACHCIQEAAGWLRKAINRKFGSKTTETTGCARLLAGAKRYKNDWIYGRLD